MLDPGGNVTNWTPAAERLKGYRAEEIVGKHFSTFYTKEDISDGKCDREVETASREGKYEDDANGHSTGLELRFEDRGPGIPDVNEALREGYSTAGGLGMGLPGAKRLMDEMEIHSVVDSGTTVTVKKWRHW